MSRTYSSKVFLHTEMQMTKEQQQEQQNKTNKQTKKTLMNERNNDHNKKGKKKTVLPPVALFRQSHRCGFPFVFIFLWFCLLLTQRF